MPILEIRRHVERADLKNNESALSPAGRAMAQTIAKRAGPYTLVLSSPLPRAKETAQLIAGRLDDTDPGLLPEMGGVIGDRIFGEMRALADWAEVLRERQDARQFAAAQLLTWGAAGVARRREGARARGLARRDHRAAGDHPRRAAWRSSRRSVLRLRRGRAGHVREGRADEDRGDARVAIRPRSTRVASFSCRRFPAFRSSDRASSASRGGCASTPRACVCESRVGRARRRGRDHASCRVPPASRGGAPQAL